MSKKCQLNGYTIISAMLTPNVPTITITDRSTSTILLTADVFAPMVLVLVLTSSPFCTNYPFTIL